MTLSAADGRTFGPAEDSAFAILDTMVQQEEPRYRLHATAKEIWGRNLDGVDPEATKAAMDATVVNTKEEAESLLEQGTRRPKTTDEIKEVRRKLALRLKKRFPEAFQSGDRAHLPATKMPTSDFTTAAAATKSGITNPFGAAGKQIDSVLKPLSESLEIRRQIAEVSSSELHHQLDELRSAIEDCASAKTLATTLTGAMADLAMLEVVTHEVLMLPSAMVADRFIDLDKQQKKANQGNLRPSAVLTQATAAGLSITVSRAPRTTSALGANTRGPRPTTTDLPSSRLPAQRPNQGQSRGARPSRSASGQRRTPTRRIDSGGRTTSRPRRPVLPLPARRPAVRRAPSRLVPQTAGPPPQGGGKNHQRKNQQPSSKKKHAGGKK